MDFAVIPECFVDTNLIETLVPPRGKGYNHQKGCGTVTKVMKEKFSDAFALGIIDKDKKQVDYLNDFTEVLNEGALILHKHKSRHHYIIQISPAIEAFILENAKLATVSIIDFNLPEDQTLFQKESKKEQSKKDPRFKNLFKAIQHAGTNDFLKLAKWVEYLIETNYRTDIKDLI